MTIGLVLIIVLLWLFKKITGKLALILTLTLVVVVPLFLFVVGYGALKDQSGAGSTGGLMSS